jgi:hypothetical protein
MAAEMTDDERQRIFDLMSARLVEMFGPGGSFRVTLARPGNDEALFVQAVADTIAWDVASGFHYTPAREAQHRVFAIDEPATPDLWAHVQAQMERLAALSGSDRQQRAA